MTAVPETQLLAARARASYERGRVRWAAVRGTAAAAIALVAMWGCPARGSAVAACTACALATGGLVTACLWRGGAWGQGVRLGFWAGLAPCWLPGLLMRAVHACSTMMCPTMPALCCAGGVLAGILLGWRAPRLERREQPQLWLAAAGAALLAGSAGCAAAGVAGLAGMALGMLAGAAPLIAVRAPA